MKKSHASSPAPVATGADAGAGGMRVLPKVFAGFGKEAAECGAVRAAVQSGAAANAGAVRLLAARGRAARKKQNRSATKEQQQSGKFGGLGGRAENAPGGNVFFGGSASRAGCVRLLAASGGAGRKKKGGIPDTFGRCCYILAAQAGRAENAPGGKVFSGVQKQAAECGAEGAAGFQPPPPAASSPSAKKKKGKADTDTSAATDIFGCAPARKSEHNARWRRLHFPSFRTAAAGQIADSANCWRNNPAEFFQKIFCGNFARAFFSKCFGPASPPPAKLPPSPLPKIRGGNSRGNFSPAPSAECRAPPPAAPATFPPVRGAAMRTALPSAPRRTFAVHLFAPAPPFGGGSGGEVGRPASGDGRDATFPAGCALLRRQRCTCAGNAARGMPDRLRGRVGARRGSVV